MATLEELVVEIDADDTGLQKGFKNSEKGIGKLGKNLIKLGGVIAGVFAGKAILDFSSHLTDVASDAEELNNKFGVVFNGVSQSVDIWIENYTDATSRGIQATKEYLASVQDIRTGYNDTIEGAAEFSKVIIGVTNDLSSFSNVDFERASAAIQSGLAGQFDALKSLGIGVNVAIIDQSDYADSINKTWLEMNNLEKQEAILTQIIAQSTNAVGQTVDRWQDYNFELGDAAKTSSGLANVQKLLTQSLTDSAAKIGNVFLPAATEMTTSLTEGIAAATPFIVATFEALQDGLARSSELIEPFVNAVSNGFSTITKVFLDFTGLTKRVSDNLTKSTQERIDALNEERDQRIQGLRDQAKAQEGFVSITNDQTKEILESRKSALKDELDILKETTGEAIDIRKDQANNAIDQIDRELDALKEAQDIKLQQIDEEFKAALKLVDTETRLRIESIEAQKDELKAEQEASDLAEKQLKQQEKLLRLKEAISEASTSDKRKSAEKDLADFERQLVLESQETERNEKLKTLDESIKAIEIEKKLDEDLLKESQKLAEEAAKNDFKLKEDSLNKEKKLLKDDLENFTKVQKSKVKEVEKAYKEIQRTVKQASEDIQTNASVIPTISIEEQIAAIEAEYDALIESQESKLEEIATKFTESEIGEKVLEAVSFVTDEIEKRIDVFSVFLESIKPFIDGVVTAYTDAYSEIFAAIVGDNKLSLTSITDFLDAARSIFEVKLKLISDVIFSWGDDIITILKDTFEILKRTILLFIEIVRPVIIKAFEEIQEFWDKWGDEIIKGFDQTFDFLLAIFKVIKDALGALRSFWREWGDEILNIMGNMLEQLFNVIGLAFDIITDLFSIFAAAINGDWDLVWKRMFELLRTILNGMKELIVTALDFWLGFFGTSLQEIEDFFVDTWTEITDFLKSIDLIEIGENIIDGLVEGIKNKFTLVKDTIKILAEGIGDGFKDILGIESPSKVFAGFGINIAEGVINGINAKKISVEQASKELGATTLSGAERGAQEQDARSVSISFDTTFNGETDEIGMIERLRQQQQEIELLLQEG
jgi:hypothetical protein